MPTIVEIKDPFGAIKNPALALVHEDQDCKTPLEWLQKNKHPEWSAFDVPTICLVNGKPILLDDYGKRLLTSKDVVTFVVVVQGLSLLLIAVVVAVIAVAVALTFAPAVGTTGDIPEADPVFSLRGQQNANNLGQPIPCQYGKIKNYPDFAARPYNQYIGNNQYQFQLYCLGHGYYDIENVRIEDTPIGNFAEVEYEVYPPGVKPTLFPDAVVTSSEVSNIELYGPNEPEYTGNAGPFVVNDVGTLTSRIEVDVVLPQGLYFQNTNGTLALNEAIAIFEYQEIDEDDIPIGAWTTLANFNKNLKTTTPQRFTYSLEVPQGRYQVRARRTNNAGTTHRDIDLIQWEAVRAFLDYDQNYGDVTLLAVKALATNNLNNNTKVRLNLYQTRKLRTYDPNTEVWSAPVATRNPIWAMIDVFTASYGARIDDSFLDLETLSALAAELDAELKYFDWSFPRTDSVWTVAKSILASVRAFPMLNGSQITALRDTDSATVGAVFTPNNIIEGSFSWEVSLFALGSYDGLEVEYMDLLTWKPETVLCTIGTETGSNPRKVKLVGITDRTRAYREGLYLRAKEVYQRQIIKLSTGLEGLIPAVNQLVAVTHDVPRWGAYSGLVLDVTGQIVTLSNEVVLEPGDDYFIAFRRKDGSSSPSYAVIEVEDEPNKLEVTDVMSEDFVRLPTQEKMFYQVGTEETLRKLCLVKKISPNNEGQTVEIELVNYRPEIYTYDAAVPPALPNRFTPPVVPDIPVVSSVEVTIVSGTTNELLIAWTPAVGATSYLVQISYDGESFTTIATTPATDINYLALSGDEVTIRVAGIGFGIGPWATWEGLVGAPSTIPDPVTNLQLSEPFTGLFAAIEWDASSLATEYIVNVRRNSDNALLRTLNTTSTSYTYSTTESEVDFAGTPERSLKFEVIATNDIGNSDVTVTITVSNPAPSAPTGITATVVNDTPTVYDISASWDAMAITDLRYYKVYASTVTGFTPGAGNLVATISANSAIFTIAKPAATIYYRVETVDYWGYEGTAISAEQSITP